MQREQNSLIPKEVLFLLHAAQNDRITVELLLPHVDAPFSSICFHLQQYIEKIMKAVLVNQGIIFRKSHDLEYLGDLLEENGIELPLMTDDLKRISAFAVTIRYEGVETGMIDREKILEIINDIEKWIDHLLRKSIH